MELCLEKLSDVELKELSKQIKNELSRRPPTIKKTHDRHMSDEYQAYLQLHRQLGPKAKTLDLVGWSFEIFVDYMSKRRPEGEIPYLREIFEEEADSRTKVWTESRKAGTAPVYTSLTHRYVHNYDSLPFI